MLLGAAKGYSLPSLTQIQFEEANHRVPRWKFYDDDCSGGDFAEKKRKNIVIIVRRRLGLILLLF